MRLAVFVIGFLLWLIAGGPVLSAGLDHHSMRLSVTFGLLGLLLWLVGLGVVKPWPRVAVVAFGMSALLLFAVSTEDITLAVWAVVALGLAFLAYLGSRQKRTGLKRNEL
jgi:hypothetical protein